MTITTIETVTLRCLSLAIDDITSAQAETNNGFIADYCGNAIEELRKAMTLAIGGAAIDSCIANQ